MALNLTFAGIIFILQFDKIFLINKLGLRRIFKNDWQMNIVNTPWYKHCESHFFAKTLTEVRNGNFLFRDGKNESFSHFFFAIGMISESKSYSSVDAADSTKKQLRSLPSSTDNLGDMNVSPPHTGITEKHLMGT